MVVVQAFIIICQLFELHFIFVVIFSCGVLHRFCSLALIFICTLLLMIFGLVLVCIITSALVVDSTFIHAYVGDFHFGTNITFGIILLRGRQPALYFLLFLSLQLMIIISVIPNLVAAIFHECNIVL